MSSSTGSPTPTHPCRWDWCREVFDTPDRLARHVLDDHVANEVPIKREDIRLEMRAFDGTSVGEDSIRTSLLMNDNAFLHEEEKYNIPPTLENGHSEQDPGTMNEAAEESRTSPNGEPVALESPVHVPSPSQAHDSQAPETLRTPSPTSRSFGAISAASSPSPDPGSMVDPPAPSLAEMLAQTINSVYSTPRKGEAGSSPMKPGSVSRHSRSSSSGIAEESRRSPATLGKRKSAEPVVDNAPHPGSRIGSRPPSSHSHRTDRSRSRSVPNQPPQDPSRLASVLSPIPETQDTTALRNGLCFDVQTSDVATSTARPFRTGSIRLEPEPSSEETNVSEPPRDDTVPPPQPQSELQIGDTHTQEPDRIFESSNLLDDTDMLSSSPNPSIPAFTQAFDVQDQSQWPLATQAPYSFDSQLAFSSQ